MQNCKLVYEPVVTSNNATDDKRRTGRSLFQLLAGAFLYLAVTTRPDEAFAVNLLSQACKSPIVQDFIAAKRVLRFLKGTKYFLTYSRHENGLGIFAYSDADWVNNNNGKTKKFVSGMVVKINESDSTVFWRTAKQCSVSISTLESEYMALSAFGSRSFVPETCI